MTSNTAPSPIVISASSFYDANHAPYMAFDQTIITNGWATTAVDLDDGNAWLQVKLDQGRKVRRYYIVSRNDGYPEQAPKTWILQGSNNGNDWINLDQQANQINWGTSEARWYEFNNTNSYQYYRLYITENNGSSNVAIEEFNIFE